ncbi:hypothetical protein AVEN_230809-1 [Araneus ventricosus]|uniref:Tc1-like transposase DDE domain-containing protein n=1 Tax=Araneus ventricosus TaxID=182803 RepID=A0A4Y2A2S9_ARAVE|nr:hypothetical protein AVEN_230809-1 [Araneus ventricosus]
MRSQRPQSDHGVAINFSKTFVNPIPSQTGCTRHFAGNDRDCSRKVSCCCTTMPDRIRFARDLKQCFRVNVLEHPLYSPDLAPSDFHLFGPVKKHLACLCISEPMPKFNKQLSACATWTLIYLCRFR